MFFVNSAHKSAFHSAMKKYRPVDEMCMYSKIYHETILLYLLTANEVTRAHLDDCVTTNSMGTAIKSDALNYGWQTEGSSSITRLAFNLFTGWAVTAFIEKADGSEEVDIAEFSKYTPFCIFSGLDGEMAKVAMEACWMQNRLG